MEQKHPRMMYLRITVGDVNMIIQSILPQSWPLKIDGEKLEFCNIVYMCIKQANNSEYKIPDNLAAVVNQIISSVHAISDHLYENDWKYNCYITIKRDYVAPNSTGKRPGWHIDGFKSDQHNYIWSDCIPTEVCTGKFELSNDHEISLEEMLTQSRGNDKFTHTLLENTLYEMNQECVHRPSVNNTDNSILRTFIKITYSTELFNCAGNAWNYKLPHIVYDKKRSADRNHTVL